MTWKEQCDVIFTTFVHETVSSEPLIHVVTYSISNNVSVLENMRITILILFRIDTGELDFMVCHWHRGVESSSALLLSLQSEPSSKIFFFHINEEVYEIFS